MITGTGRLMTGVSASQIDTFKTCRRKWYFSSVLKLPRTQAASAALGTELHEYNERYLLTGETPNKNTEAGRLFYAGLPLLPAPGSVLAEIDIEKKAVPGFSLAGIVVRGKIDQTDLRGNEPHIEDYKSSSSLRYTLSEEQLTKDPQIIIYAAWVKQFVRTLGRPEPEGVGVSHLVYLTKGQNVVRRTGPVRLLRNSIDNQFSALSTIVEKMKETSIFPSVDLVEPTLSACYKYNRECDFAKYCKAFNAVSGGSSTISSSRSGGSPFAGIENAGRDNPAPVLTTPTLTTPTLTSTSTPIPTEYTMNPLDALAALAAKNRAATNGVSAHAAHPILPPVTQAPPAPVVQPATQAAPQGPVKSALEMLAEKARAASNGVTQPARGLLPADAPPQVAAAPAAAPVAAAPVVTPPAEPPAAAPVVTAAPLTQLHSRKPKGYMTKLTALGYTESQIEDMGVDRMHEVIDDDVRADAPTAPVVQEAPVEVAAPVQVELPKAQVPVLKQQAGLTLYIDCMPSKGAFASFQRLEDILLPYMANVAAGGNKGDGRSPLPHYNMLEYGQGTARVVASILTNPPSGVIVADRRYPCTDAVLEVLVPMAETVIRSLR